MSLSGNLGFVSLDEVLRLLNRSKQRGVLEVRGGDNHGRIFVDRGSVVLATMLNDDQLHRHLAKSGLGQGGDTAAVTELLREMTVESIYQLGLNGESFQVIENQHSPYPNPTPFDLEELLVEARRRLSDWADVGSAITDLDALIRMRRDLGNRDEVTIGKDSWRLLSEVGHGASVRSLAEELGTTEFWTARVAAGLISDELLTMEAPAAPIAPEAETRGAEPAEPWTGQEPVSFAEAGEPADETPVEGSPAPTADDTEQVFHTDEESPAYVGADPAGAESAHQVDPNQSWWNEPDPARSGDEGESEDVEGDTEAFLEKVFSGLEPEEASEEGYGLLRRRRMGALRDLSNDA